MAKIFEFGTVMEEYPVPVVNEREIRAGAGIMFVLAFYSFMQAFLVGEFFYIKLLVIGFLIEFFIRVLINPKFAPFLVLGRVVTINQTPDFSGAPQKRFAWALGLILALIMLVVIVILNVTGPINMMVCLLCLTLLFCESAFGICIGCKLYNLFSKEKSKLCPGGACEIPQKYAVQELKPAHYIVTIIAIAFVVVISIPLANYHRISIIEKKQANLANPDRCVVPEFAKKLGHEQQWKLHNGC